MAVEFTQAKANQNGDGGQVAAAAKHPGKPDLQQSRTGSAGTHSRLFEAGISREQCR
jgi:hypothetical protein